MAPNGTHHVKQQGMLFLKLVVESFNFAYKSLIVNPLRTFLSLLGITIGIFSIISIFTIFDSMERTVRNSMDKLGGNVVYLQKWPWTPPPGENEYPWWKYLNRPVPKLLEAEEIQRRSTLSQNVIYNFGFNRTIQSGSNKADDVTVIGSTSGLIEAWDLKVSDGRPLTDTELDGASSFAMIGANLATQLFPSGSAVGQPLKVQGFTVFIVGTFDKMGDDMFGTSMDNRILLPARFASRMVDPRWDIGQSIIVKGKSDISAQRLKEELEGIMRAIRRIKPAAENDFALNEVSLIAGQLDSLFAVFNIAGWIIGGFSILVGGFGIANIMFVSVRERTKIIGIQKALGAKSRFVLLEFLFEASVLSLIGGALGLLLIFIGTLIAKHAFDFELVLSVGNILRGLIVSAVIGLVAGTIPAKKAAGLDPVTAMNTI